MKAHNAPGPSCENYRGSNTLGSEFKFLSYTGTMLPSEKTK